MPNGGRLILIIITIITILSTIEVFVSENYPFLVLISRIVKLIIAVPCALVCISVLMYFFWEMYEGWKFKRNT